MLTFDVALWLRSSSPEPEIVTYCEVDPSLTMLDAVLLLMRERKENYVFMAAVNTPYGLERFSRLSLPFEVPACQHTAHEIVSLLWPVVEADGIDPVEVGSADALGLLRALASGDPGSPFALWSQSALAVDERLFSAFWNDRRAAEARRRLWLEEEEEVQHAG